MEEPRSKKQKVELCRQAWEDVILDVNGIDFPVNRLILQKEFGVIGKKLIHMPSGANRLKIAYKNPLLVQKVLCFINGKYVRMDHGIEKSGEPIAIEEVIQISEVGSALDLALRWDGQALQKELFSYLKRNLDKDSFYEINCLTENYLDLELEDRCREVLTRNFCQLCQDDRFNQLDEIRVLSAMQSLDFRTACSREVFEALISWVEYDVSRQSNFEELFACVDLRNLSPDYLETRVESNVLVKNNAVCLSKVQKTYREIYEGSEGVVIPTGLKDLRIFYTALNRSDRIKQPSQLSYFSWINGMVCHQSLLYVFFNNRSVFQLDLMANDITWKEIAPTHYTNSGLKLNVTIVHGEVFVLEGNHCEKYLMATNTWEVIRISALKTREYSVASVGGFIYIIGIAKFSSGILPSMEIFDPFDGIVRSSSPMNFPISFPSTSVLGENIYAAGPPERDQPFSVQIEYFDTKTHIWTTIPFMQSSRMSIKSSFVSNNSVYFVGQMGNAKSPGKIYTLSIPNIFGHQEIHELHGADRFNCEVNAVIPRNLRYDFIVKVGNKEFPAHRKTLSTFSKYFEAMFRSDMSETETGIVNMLGIDSCVVRKCIDFAYNATCPAFTLENAEQFLHAAVYLQSFELREALEKFFLQQLNIHTFEHLKTLSHKYSCFEVEEACDEFALANLEHIIKLPCFTTMEIEYIKFLMSSRKDGDNEIAAFNWIVHWVKAGNGSREIYFHDLLSLLNLAKLPDTCVHDKILSEELVKNNSMCLATVEESRRQRIELHEVLCFVHTRNDQSGNFSVYSPKLLQWKTIWTNRDLPKVRRGDNCSLLTIGQYFYLLIEKTLHKLDYRNDHASWKYVKRTNAGPHLYKTVAAIDCVFIIGAMVIKEFNSAKNKWRTIPIMVGRFNFTLVAVEKHIYILGGTDVHGQQSASTQRYDIVTKSLETNLSEMHQPRTDAAAAYHDGRVFVTGGFNGVTHDSLKGAEAYNISKDSWTVLVDMNFPRHKHSAFIIDGILYAVGGDENSPNTMESYDEYDQAWKIDVIPEAACNRLRHIVTLGRLPYESLC